MADNFDGKNSSRNLRNKSSKKPESSSSPSSVRPTGQDGRQFTCDKDELTNLNSKLDTIIKTLESMGTRITNLEIKLDETSLQISTHHNDISDLKEAVEFNQKQNATLKALINNNADGNHSSISQLEDRLEDLENRSRRNNIIIHGIPEGSERDQPCEEFLSDFLTNHMKIDGGKDFEIERAHRTPSRRQSTPQPDGTNSRPRPIHCKLLRYGDRHHILKNAAKLLRNNQYKGANIFISDDVSAKARNARKQLREDHLPSIRQDERVNFAFVPWSLPPVIMYKLHSGAFKSFTLRDRREQHRDRRVSALPPSLD